MITAIQVGDDWGMAWGGGGDDRSVKGQNMDTF